MRAKLSLIDLVNALESSVPGLRWRVDLVTGDVLLAGSVASDAAPERFPALPPAGDLPESDIRRDFCDCVRDSTVREALSALIDVQAPSRQFETAVRRGGLLDEWLAHRRSRLVPVALAWAAAQDVICRDVSSPTFAL